ncbi:hypothetical protein Glove_461g57 [Diversispora epigaea]|uniref:Uncharacterized protein n=1 Tax=Diversispora epigaea TaxID=1348612 RepID=A0A397GSH7_9GLOM|nr:hypothetical protein Glove_461g57 [Diversispora epigaea]
MIRITTKRNFSDPSTAGDYVPKPNETQKNLRFGQLVLGQMFLNHMKTFTKYLDKRNTISKDKYSTAIGQERLENLISNKKLSPVNKDVDQKQLVEELRD